MKSSGIELMEHVQGLHNENKHVTCVYTHSKEGTWCSSVQED